MTDEGGVAEPEPGDDGEFAEAPGGPAQYFPQEPPQEFPYEPEDEEPVDEELDDGLIFTSLDSFVTEYLGEILRRRLNRATAVWCPSWWRHPEAVVRLSAMWRAFEYLRTDPALGMSVWWLNHADPHLRVLMDPEFGPFAVCDPREGHNARELEPLPMDPSPPEMWDHPAYSLEAAIRAEAEEGLPADQFRGAELDDGTTATGGPPSTGGHFKDFGPDR
ncbi:MAG: DUF4913 domain-containing protein [Streptomycetaceae bacterium]|nr:DUF4913 domain-containing protein [Streptomycetaceae bacterium]